MGNNDLIQEVINDLNYEIIQLKYKNETNVTMRIDSIIGFLEQVKDDVIKAQGNQKFDLHRTATNCTITILDEDNDPITDGSNKLSYGDVIKISVVASEGYENATLSVNGLPFTSGNTMVVKNDLTIVGSATAIPVVLTPFAVNDVLSSGDKIHFDTSKASELLTVLQGLTYDEYGASNLMLMSDNAYPVLSVFNMNGVYLLIAGDKEFDKGGFIYASASGEIESIEFNAGFSNNIDSNGDYTWSSNESVISSINDTTPPTWNGIIISKG